MKHATKLALLTGCLAVVLSCASSKTELNQVWTDPSLAEHRIQKIMILGIAPSEANRRIFEEQLSAQFAEHGVTAVPGATLIPVGTEIDKETVKSAIEGKGFDSVLVTSVIGVDKEIEHRPGTTYSVPQTSYTRHYGYIVVTYEEVNTPGYLEEHEIVKLETNIYDTESEMLMWSALSEIFDPESVEKATETFGKVILGNLKTTGYIN